MTGSAPGGAGTSPAAAGSLLAALGSSPRPGSFKGGSLGVVKKLGKASSTARFCPRTGTSRASARLGRRLPRLSLRTAPLT